MSQQLPIWKASGVEPPEELKTTGWQPGMKPSAQHMNWLFNQLSILATNAGVTVEDLLTSTSTQNALSAKQGKVLKELIDTKTNNTALTELEQRLTTHLDDMVKIIQNVTLLASSWVNNTAIGFWTYTYTNANITAKTIVDVNVQLASLNAASTLSSVTSSSNGFVTLYATSKPTSNIIVDVKIVKEGV